MPRLPTSLLRRAYTISPLLPLLLRPCRDLRSAQNELRWLREHVDRVARTRRRKGGTLDKGSLMRELVGKRARGVPLQYLLGTEWFGDVEIKCRSGVLIPRQDTASSIQHLVHLLRSATTLPPELRVLDLCTGTGCIPLLFQHDFYSAASVSSGPISSTDLRILGVDISEKALNLASHNLARTRKQKDWVDRGAINFMQADILLSPFADQSPGPLSLQAALNWGKHPQFWDILISNPPYISPSAYWKTTTRSVRGFEPKLALVPPSDAGDDDVGIGDAFYRSLLNIARYAEAKIAFFEVADLDQALRVARRARKQQIYDGIEIWRDQPDQNSAPHEHAEETNGDEFPILGQGNARSVLCYRGAGTQWLGKSVVENRPEGDAATLSRQEAHDLGVLNNFFRF